MIPNMAHCGGGPATNDFAVNELNAITAWVENGIAPEQSLQLIIIPVPLPQYGIIRSARRIEFPDRRHAATVSVPPNYEIQRVGSTNNAANFVCVRHDDRLDVEEDDDEDGNDRAAENH